MRDSAPLLSRTRLSFGSDCNTVNDFCGVVLVVVVVVVVVVFVLEFVVVVVVAVRVVGVVVTSIIGAPFLIALIVGRKGAHHAQS